MDPRSAEDEQHGSSSPTVAAEASDSKEEHRPPPPPSPAPALRRRLSMEEDFLYHQIMTSPRRSSQPPPYEFQPRRRSSAVAAKGLTGHSARGLVQGDGGDDADEEDGKNEKLPDYSCSVECEGVFSKKMEIEDTVKRALDRQWHACYVTLRGTALNIYNVKKDWGWGRSRGGPTISPDNPPWVKKSSLEKSYSLLHADVGIAADYKK
jgi:hypothetical protein